MMRVYVLLHEQLDDGKENRMISFLIHLQLFNFGKLWFCFWNSGWNGRDGVVFCLS